MTAAMQWAPTVTRHRTAGRLDEPRVLCVDETAELPHSLSVHEELFGTLPRGSADDLFRAATDSGLTGRGGAAFPAHRKMAGVRSGPAPRVVVGNGAEGEPAAAKDKTLLTTNPHLVLDGLQVAARIVGAARAYLYVHDEPRVVAAVLRATAERRALGVDDLDVEVVTAPARFVSGEESAVVSRISGGPALPRSKPPRVFESGVLGRPTLVQNVETLAHLALIARHGAADFRRFGSAEQPGTILFTVTGAVHTPGVIEAPVGVTMAELIAAADGLAAHPQAVLLGGYHGAWVSWPAARDLVMSNDALRPQGLSVGAGVVVIFPADACGPTEVTRVLEYLARESAGQCGPCVFGLPALAESFGRLVDGGRARRHHRRLAELPDLLERRGGCSHPDGSLRFLRSAQTVFAGHLQEHRAGRCHAERAPGLLPIPA